MTMTYEAWRISFQSSEQAARAAYAAAAKHAAECEALAAHVERIIHEWNSGDDLFSDEWINRMGEIVEDAPENSLTQRDDQIRDHSTRCQTAVCCAMLARQNDLTMVEEILIAAGMTEPSDFVGCAQEDIDEIAEIQPRRIRVKEDQTEAGDEP